MTGFKRRPASFSAVVFFTVAVWLFSLPVWANPQVVADDAIALVKANKSFFLMMYREALDTYGKVTSTDPALYREAHLGKCMCLAMLGFLACTPEDAIEHFRKLINEATTSAPLDGLKDGSLPINKQFFIDLMGIFTTTGSLAGGDVAQGMVLEADSNFIQYSEVIKELGTIAQKNFVQLFKCSMKLSEATVKLLRNDFEGCIILADFVSGVTKSEHIEKERKALQSHAKRLIETRENVDVLKSSLDTIVLSPEDPNFAALEKVKELVEQIQKSLHITDALGSKQNQPTK